MAATGTAVWGIHAGKTGDADTLFLKKGVIALGWQEVSDLSAIPATRDAFKAKVAATYPDDKPGSIPGQAGQLYRFVHEMKPSDVVVYPSQRDRQIHIGIVTGPYTYNPKLDTGYPNQRAVDWRKAVPRASLTQGALYEVGAAMSLFSVKNYAAEFLDALEGVAGKKPVETDDTVLQVASQTQENTRDFILKRLSQDLKGHPLAELVAHLLGTMGYRCRVSPPGPDSGVDIIAHKDELGFEPPLIKVQVKSGDGSIGDPVVSALSGKLGSGEFGLLVTLGAFTAQARNTERNKGNLRLIDGTELVNLILAHYEQFDSRYKGLLPLVKVYVPELVVEQEQ